MAAPHAEVDLEPLQVAPEVLDDLRSAQINGLAVIGQA